VNRPGAATSLGRRQKSVLIAFFIFFVILISAVPPASAMTIVNAVPSVGTFYFAQSFGNKIGNLVQMSVDSFMQICIVNGSILPSFRMDVPFKLNGSTFAGLSAPWNKKGLDLDGRHFYKWNIANPSLGASQCGALDATGTTKIEAGFNMTRKVTPSVLSQSTTSVKVVVKIDVKEPVPDFCMSQYDYSSANTIANLTSWDLKSSAMGTAPMSTAIPQVTQGLHNLSLCIVSLRSASTYTLTTLWDVAKLASGNVSWKPSVFAGIAEFSDTITPSSTSIVFDQALLPQTHDTLTISTSTSGVVFNWLGPMNSGQEINLLLQGVSTAT
jgi:hypothetical protein